MRVTDTRHLRRSRAVVFSLSVASLSASSPTEADPGDRRCAPRGRRLPHRAGRLISISAVLLAALGLLATATDRAAAHVEVLPGEAVAGEAQRFTIRVPSERDVATVAVRVLFPEEVLVYSVKPAPGWTTRFLYRPDGRTRGVEITGGRIGEGRFQEFDVLGTPQLAGTAIWTARQTYADGLVKPWTGPPEEPGQPAAETGPEDPGPGSATVIRAEVSATPTSAADEGSGGSSAGVWLGLIAIVISASAALGVGILWSSRPAPLPDDEE